MNLIEKIIKILFHPTEFFEEIKEERGILHAFLYLMIISIIPTISSFFLTLFAIPYVETVSIMMAAVYFGILIFSFILAIVIHLFVKLFKGEGNFSSTYRVIAYSYTPFFLFSWVLFVNIVIGLYSLYLMIKGLSIIHNISKAKSFIGLTLSLIIFTGLFYIFQIYLFTSGPIQTYNYAERLNKKALETNDTSLCGKINKGYALYYTCYQTLAVRLRDESICDLISDNNDKAVCKAILEGIKTRTLGPCDGIEEGISLKNDRGSYNRQRDCYTVVIKSLNEPELCEIFTDYYAKKDCYFSIAVSTNNADLCEKAAGDMGSCYYKIAKNTMDISLCDKAFSKLNPRWIMCRAVISLNESKCQEISSTPVEEPLLKHQCYYDIIEITKDPSVCENFSGLDKDKCYSYVAELTKNVELCEKIIDDFTKQMCKVNAS